MNKSFFFLPLIALLSCSDNLPERAAADAAEYTRKYCPTPATQYTRNDSVTFDRSTRTFCYHYTALGALDNAKMMTYNAEKVEKAVRTGIADNTGLKVYKNAGYSFRYVVRSAKDPSKVLFETTVTEDDYKR